MRRRTCTHTRTHARTRMRTCVWLERSSQNLCVSVSVFACGPAIIWSIGAGMSGYVEQCVPDAGHTHTKQHWCSSALVWIFNKPQSICSIIHEEGHRIVSKYKHRYFSPAFAASSLLSFCTSLALPLPPLSSSSLCFFFVPSFFLSFSLSRSHCAAVVNISDGGVVFKLPPFGFRSPHMVWSAFLSHTQSDS